MGDNFAKIEHIFRQENILIGAATLWAAHKSLTKYINATFTGKNKSKRYVEAAKIINARKPEAVSVTGDNFMSAKEVRELIAPLTKEQPKTVIEVPVTNGKYKEAVYDEYELLRGSLNTFLHDIESFIVLKVQKVKAQNELLREENKEMKKALDDAKFYNFVGTLKKKLG